MLYTSTKSDETDWARKYPNPILLSVKGGYARIRVQLDEVGRAVMVDES